MKKILIKLGIFVQGFLSMNLAQCLFLVFFVFNVSLRISYNALEASLKLISAFIKIILIFKMIS